MLETIFFREAASSWKLTGLSKKSTMPLRRASLAASRVAQPVTISTFTEGTEAIICLATSMPLINGMLMSIITICG